MELHARRSQSGVSSHPVSPRAKHDYVLQSEFEKSINCNNTRKFFDKSYKYMQKCCWVTCVLSIVTLWATIVFIGLNYYYSDPLIPNLTLVSSILMGISENHITDVNFQIEQLQFEHVYQQYPVSLIGIGAMKSGSTFFIDAITASNPYLNTSKIVRDRNLNGQKLHRFDKSYFTSFDYFDHSLYNRDMKTVIDQIDINMNQDTINRVAFPLKLKFLQGFDSEMHFYTWCAVSDNFLVRFLIENISHRKGKSFEQRLKKCKHCEWNSYISLFNYSNVNFSHYVRLDRVPKFADTPKNKGILDNAIRYEKKSTILTEKTPNYIREPHSLMLLIYYASIKPLKFYLLLRNPIDRTYSHYLYHCSTQKWGYCNNNTKIFEIMEKDYKNLKHDNIYFYQMFKLINSDNFKDNYNKNKNIEFDEINRNLMKLFINGIYSYNSIIAEKNIFTAQSCYFPQLMIFYRFYSKYHIESGNKKRNYYNYNKTIGNMLKVFTFDQIRTNISDVIWELKCWLINGIHINDINYSLECRNQYKKMSKDRQNYPRRGKLATFTSKKETMPINLKTQLTEMFYGCNKMLVNFVEQNPTILLLDKHQTQLQFENW